MSSISGKFTNFLLYFTAEPTDEDYDSADSIGSDIEDDADEEDVFSDPFSNDIKATQASEMMKKHRRENTEHSNPYSYSWNVIRLAVMKLAQHQLQEFIGIAGIEMQGMIRTVTLRTLYKSFTYLSELPVASPLIHGILRTLTSWQDLIKEELSLRGPAPPDYIPGKSLRYSFARSVLYMHSTLNRLLRRNRSQGSGHS